MKFGVVGETKTGEKVYFVKSGAEGEQPVLSSNIADMFKGWNEKGATFKSTRLDREFPDIKFSPYPVDEDQFA